LKAYVEAEHALEMKSVARKPKGTRHS
jgi:hypothetical protein